MRCFVALWPDTAARTRLDHLARQLQRRLTHCRRIDARDLHLTLAFIGELDAPRAGALAAQIARLGPQPVRWTLDATGAFDGARVLWAGGPPTPALHDLAVRVRSLLEGDAIAYDRKPFVPHVTLLRGLRRDDAPMAAGTIEPPIDWQAEGPVLLHSARDASGSRYAEVPVADAA
jgi:2'-5' RNA ligase